VKIFAIYSDNKEILSRIPKEVKTIKLNKKNNPTKNGQINAFKNKLYKSPTCM
jgi:hypothetical protein